jgi:hypothetical protein
MSGKLSHDFEDERSRADVSQRPNKHPLGIASDLERDRLLLVKRLGQTAEAAQVILPAIGRR